MKMFMSVEEAANKLNIHPIQIPFLCEIGLLSEFRCGIKGDLLLKAEQVELLAMSELPDLPTPEMLAGDRRLKYEQPPATTLLDRVLKVLWPFK